MPASAKAALLVVALCGAFVCCGQILSSVGGNEGPTVSGDVGLEQGSSVFFGKGKCYTCHSLGNRGAAVRGPNLGMWGETFREPVGIRAARRKKDKGYSAIKYLVESLYDPDAFVVPGFPKGLMTPVHWPPIALADDEIASVILFLLAESDVDTGAAALDELRAVQRTFSSLRQPNVASIPAIRVPRGDAQQGRVTFAKVGCTGCHKVGGVHFDKPPSPVDGLPVAGAIVIPEGVTAPDLTSVGAVQTREYLFESIMTPNAVIVADPPGVTWGDKESYAGKDGWSKMPLFHSTLTVKDMLDLVAFLETLSDEKQNANRYPSTRSDP